VVFLFHASATSEIYTLSLHDALPILTRANGWVVQPEAFVSLKAGGGFLSGGAWASYELGNAGPNDLSDLGTGNAGLAELNYWGRSEEHTSELQSRFDLVCRLLLEKKK